MTGARRARAALRIAVSMPALLLPACGEESADLTLVGTVERTLVELVAPASEVILEVHGTRGAHVAAGEVVVRLDPTLANAEVASAEAALAGARTGVAVADQELSRLERLYRARIASEQDLDRARLSHDEAEARLREAEARLAAARKRLADLTLASPVAGVLDQIPFDPGERVPAGAVVGVVLADAEPWVRVWIPERAYAAVRAGSPAEVLLDGVAGARRGRVLDIAREPEYTPHFALTERERGHLVYEARVLIEDPPPGLRPGVPAEVRLAARGS
jgi:HlyD family secretion protein